MNTPTTSRILERPLRWAGGLLLGGLLAASPAQGGRIEGRLALLPAGDAEVSEAVVWFQPRNPYPLTAADAPAVMATRGKQFVPQVLVLAKGGSVRFPNGDPILHNVFSVSGANRFDLGLYGEGAGQSWRFGTPGIVRVFCNVHQEMVGWIVVVDTPFYAQPDRNGDFAIDVSSEGPGTLIAWHPRAEVWSEQLPNSSAVVAPRLEINRKRIPPHTNKHGRSYRGRRGRY
jgi:plastocyanin